jgi:hypothetical protein
MKHVVLMGLAMLSVISCSQPSENKVDTLIQESVKKSLSHPESYLAIETVVDSAFAPFDDPSFYERTLEISKMTLENLEYVRKAQEAVRYLKSKQYAHMTDSDKIQYRRYKNISNLYNKKVDSLSAKIQGKGRKLMEMTGTDYRFIGFKVMHVYSAEDDGGNTAIKKRIFIVDDKWTKSLAEYDASSKEYIMVQTMYRMWEEETVSLISNI